MVRPRTLTLLILGLLGAGWASWSLLRPAAVPQPSADPSVPPPSAVTDRREPQEVPGEPVGDWTAAESAATPRTSASDAPPDGVELPESLGAAAEPPGPTAPAAPAEPSAEPGLSARDRHAQQWIVERSRRFADQLALAPGTETRIAELLLEADRRLAEVRREARALGASPADRAQLREAAAEVRAWRDAAFEQAFGPDLGQQILSLEDGPTILGDAGGAPPPPANEAGEASDG